MAYQFYQNSKLVQNQLEQNQDSVNQSIQSSINEYKQNFAQANYDYAVDLAQEQAGKTIERTLGESELFAGIPAAFNAIKTGIPAAKNLINKIRGTPTETEEVPSIPDDSLGEAPKEPLPEEPVERSVEYDNPAFSGSDISESASGVAENVLGEDVDTGARGVLSAEDVNQLTFPAESTAESTADVVDSTASDIITSSVQATDVVEKAASKSIWSEIGDAFADIGLGVADILDPVADIAEAGIAVAGVGLGAKSIADSEKKTDIAPPVEQQQSLLQTSNISAVSQPGI